MVGLTSPSPFSIVSFPPREEGETYRLEGTQDMKALQSSRSIAILNKVRIQKERASFYRIQWKRNCQSNCTGQVDKMIRSVSVSPLELARPSNFASGEGGCVADAEFSADRGHVSRPGIVLLPGLPGGTKLLEKRASSLSDAPRVYID